MEPFISAQLSTLMRTFHNPLNTPEPTTAQTVAQWFNFGSQPATPAAAPLPKLTDHMVETDLLPLIHYFERHFGLLAENLSPSMSQDVIIKAWAETVALAEGRMIPTLYGEMEKERKIWNERAVGGMERVLKVR